MRGVDEGQFTIFARAADHCPLRFLTESFGKDSVRKIQLLYYDVWVLQARYFLFKKPFLLSSSISKRDR